MLFDDDDDASVPPLQAEVLCVLIQIKCWFCFRLLLSACFAVVLFHFNLLHAETFVFVAQGALEAYSSCLQWIPDNNLSIRRDVLEGMARCCTKLGQKEKALDLTELLVNLLLWGHTHVNYH